MTGFQEDPHVCEALVGQSRCCYPFLLLFDPVHRVVDPLDPLIQITEEKVVRSHEFADVRHATRDLLPGCQQESGCSRNEDGKRGVHDGGR